MAEGRKKGQKERVPKEQRVSPPKHTPGKQLSDDAKAWFYAQVRNGRNAFQVGAQLGISRTTVRNLLEKASGAYLHGNELTPSKVAERMGKGDPGELVEYPEPVMRLEDLRNPQAKQAWREFGYYRRRFFHRRHIPWQIEMCVILMDWMEEFARKGERGKGILNTPPGGGKTTTVTHDFPAWLVTRNRDIRIALGSRTNPQAEKYTRRVRTTFEKNALMNLEFGRFKPLEPDLWRQGQFTVDGVTGHEPSMDYKLALGGYDPDDPAVKRSLKDPEDEIHDILEALSTVFLTAEKEPTISALSQEMGFLGGRYELCVWDDLVDRSNSRTPDQRDALAEWWHLEAESRCEPGGIVALVGTRYGRYDLFRHCKDLTFAIDDVFEAEVLENLSGNMTEEEIAEVREDMEKELVDKYDYTPDEIGQSIGDEDGQPTSRRRQKVYKYVSFPAHDEDKCEHPRSLKGSDHEDCLLDPLRFKWYDLMRAKASSPRKYALTYQQEDETDEGNLVEEVWLTGGVDSHGLIVPGCYNYGRRLLQIPEELEGKRDKVFSVATVDPSAVNWWSIQWWLWDSEEDKDYLINLERLHMGAGGFLDWDQNTREYRGILHAWQWASAMAGWPIKVWVVEQAGAQRYLFQYKFVHNWMRENRTFIKGHETAGRKSDKDLGITTLSPRYRVGAVDLPYDEQDLKTQAVIKEMAQELLDWPDGQTEDMIMGHWFLHFNRYQLPSNLSAGAKDGGKHEHPYQDTVPKRLQQYDRLGRRVESDNPRHVPRRMRS